MFLVTNDLYESSSCSISDINLLKKENYVFEKIVLYNETTTQYNKIEKAKVKTLAFIRLRSLEIDQRICPYPNHLPIRDVQIRPH